MLIELDFWGYVGLGVLLLAGELLYFRLAKQYQIIDRPNERSSHLSPVIRGGGVVFALALVLWFLFSGQLYPWFVLGGVAVGVVSFIDDVSSQPPLIRTLVHLLSVLLIFYQLSLFAWPWWLLAAVLIVCIGTLNAFNFMDGINGITGVYALVSLSTFWYLDQYIADFTVESLAITMIGAVLIFLFFNFRRRAKCFAGDVGSVTLAFVQVFLLLQLIAETGNFAWVFLMLVFGVDSVLTIIFRIRNQENIFKAHRTHLYQYLSNEMKVPHLWVSVAYGLLQLMINVLLIQYADGFNLAIIWIIAAYAVLYLVARSIVINKVRGQRSVEGGANS